jgi:methylmalonyl-CoA carboxyltransferase small subunit
LKLKLTIDGNVYEVDVEATEPEKPRSSAAHGSPPRPAAPPMIPLPPAANGNAPVADESKVCRSPVAGVVVKITAQAGQAIQANDVLMVLEAMKMETTITSPVAGRLIRVNAAVGDSVQGGQVLAEFE